MSSQTLPPARQALYWALFGVAVILLLTWLKAVLLPFVAALILAYLLDPVVDKLEAKRWPRWAGSLVVLLGFILAVAGIISLAVPLINGQLALLIDKAPAYVEQLKNGLTPLLQQAQQLLGEGEAIQGKLQQAAEERAGDIVKMSTKLISSIVGGALGALSALPLLFLTPVIGFYLLRDWPHMVNTVRGMLPQQHRAVILEQVAEVDRTIAGFIRGQTLVCLCLAAFYAIALSVAGLELGFVIGVLSGILSFIPYVGSIFGGIASIGLAFGQFGLESWERIVIIASIYLFGQFVEGNVLSPKLVGSRVNLHPVWVIFALFAGGALYGFLGVLLAVPVAAALGVLIRFGVERYKASRLYVS